MLHTYDNFILFAKISNISSIISKMTCKVKNTQPNLLRDYPVGCTIFWNLTSSDLQTGVLPGKSSLSKQKSFKLRNIKVDKMATVIKVHMYPDSPLQWLLVTNGPSN